MSVIPLPHPDAGPHVEPCARNYPDAHAAVRTHRASGHDVRPTVAYAWWCYTCATELPEDDSQRRTNLDGIAQARSALRQRQER